MRCITIWQPWATLIALEEKKFETRSWSTAYRGSLGIHAAKKIDRLACEREPIKTILAKHGYTVENLPMGAVVAICTLKQCWQVNADVPDELVLEASDRASDGQWNQAIDAQEMAVGNFTAGRFAWQLTEVQLLTEPVPAKGMQGLWKWLPPASSIDQLLKPD